MRAIAMRAIALGVSLFAAWSATAAEQRVTVGENGFDPARVTVKVNDTIRFTNARRDNLFLFAVRRGHVLDIRPGRDALTHRPGDTVPMLMPAPGRYQVLDALHGDLTMSIEVTP
jgi:plastocyanin